MNQISELVWATAISSGVLWIFTGWTIAGWLCIVVVIVSIALPLPNSHFKSRGER